MTYNKSKLTAAVVWILLTLFFCYQYLLRMLPNLIWPELTHKFDLSATQFSTFASVYYIGYILCSVPIGFAISRFNNKFLLTIAAILTLAGLIPIIYSGNWYLIVAGRLLTGIGSSAAVVGIFQIFSTLFAKRFSLALGATVSFSLLTISLGSNPLTHMLMEKGVDRVIAILLIFGIVLALLILVLFPNFSSIGENSDPINDIKAVLGNKKLMFSCILSGLMMSPLQGFSDGFGTAFMQIVYNLERPDATFIVFSILTGTCIGCILLPYLAEKYRAYYSITILSALIMGLCFTCLAFGYGNARMLTFICYTIGIFCGYQVVIVTEILNFVPKRLNGLAGSAINMIVMLLGPIFHYAIGACMDSAWDGVIKEGARFYSRQAYLTGITPIPIAMFIAAIGFVSLVIFEKQQHKR